MARNERLEIDAVQIVERADKFRRVAAKKIGRGMDDEVAADQYLLLRQVNDRIARRVSPTEKHYPHLAAPEIDAYLRAEREIRRAVDKLYKLGLDRLDTGDGLGVFFLLGIGQRLVVVSFPVATICFSRSPRFGNRSNQPGL